MKDITIKAKTIRRELYFLLLSFGLAFILNIVGIAKHGTQWIELITQIHVVLILTFVIYILLWFVRLLAMLVLRPFRKK
ncbi:MAG: hypothetical protein V2I37_01530 [Marinilabiliaceae bacterium]|jgi:hypothetical protein|nr:hypothetical protein [Marinilabiliaceae bacterium]